MGMLHQGVDDSHLWWERGRFHRATQNGGQLKTYKLFIFGIFHSIFSDCNRSWATETPENETEDKGLGWGGVSIVYETLGIRQKTMTPERQKRKRWEPYHCLRLLQKAHSQAVSQGMEWQVASVVSFHRIDGTEDLKRSGILNAWDREQEKRKLRRARTPELWSKYLLSIQQDSNGQIHVKKRPRFKKNGRNSTHTPTKLRRGIPTKQTREPHNSQSAG